MANVIPPPDLRRMAPAVQRNREPILAVLERYFPASGRVLEVASGTGEHAVFFCGHLKGLTWQPTDVDPSNLASIAAWREFSGLDNLLAPMVVDLVREPTAGAALYDAAFCANLIHIAPWIVCQRLMRFVGAVLEDNARFIMYGPYKVDGQHTAESNAAFEQWLWGQSPEYGVRDLAEVVAEADKNQLELLERVAMPANNFCLIFSRKGRV